MRRGSTGDLAALNRSLPIRLAASLDTYFENRFQQNLRNGVVNLLAFVFLLIVGTGYLISGWTGFGIFMLVLSVISIVTGAWDIWIYRRNLPPIARNSQLAFFEDNHGRVRHDKLRLHGARAWLLRVRQFDNTHAGPRLVEFDRDCFGLHLYRLRFGSPNVSIHFMLGTRSAINLITTGLFCSRLRTYPSGPPSRAVRGGQVRVQPLRPCTDSRRRQAVWRTVETLPNASHRI
jgi:hypothetical protein